MKWIVEAETREDLVDGHWFGGEELVRCRECKYWKTYQGIKGVKFCTYVVGAEFVREPEDYCSRGDRKADDVD